MAEKAKKVCSVVGCGKQVVARGLCRKDYDEARKAGRIEVNQPHRRKGGKGKQQRAKPKPRPKAETKPNEFGKELRELVRLNDQGAQVVFDVDGRKFTILEVDLTVKG